MSTSTSGPGSSNACTDPSALVFELSDYFKAEEPRTYVPFVEDGTLDVTSVCITKNTSFLSLAEVIFEGLDPTPTPTPSPSPTPSPTPTPSPSPTSMPNPPMSITMPNGDMVSQSSTSEGGEPDKAVYSVEGASLTAAGDDNPWWNIEFPNPQPVGAVKVIGAAGSGHNFGDSVTVSETASNACLGGPSASFALDDDGPNEKIVWFDVSNPDYHYNRSVKSLCIRQSEEFLSISSVLYYIVD